MNQYQPCPKCRTAGATRMSFTWWGGILGPKMLTHVRCPHCGHKYNGKTGRDNTTGIIIYSVIVGILGLAFAVVLFAIAGVILFSNR